MCSFKRVPFKQRPRRSDFKGASGGIRLSAKPIAQCRLFDLNGNTQAILQTL